MEPQKAKYGEQMKAWALDRALEAHKSNPVTPDKVLETAELFVAWVSNPPEELDEPTQESVQ